MAPTVYHRIRWNSGGKQDVVRVGHRLFLTGTACLAAGMFCAIFVVSDFLFGLCAALLASAILLALVGWTWYLLPVERGQDPSVRRLE
jgi:hypothetical protein